MRKAVIGLTMGDPGGIGPEVIIKALLKHKKNPRLSYVIFGAPEPFEYLKRKHGLKISSPHIHARDLSCAQPGALFFCPSASSLDGFDIGKVSKRNACNAFGALETATHAALQGSLQAIVTAPINKTTMRLMDTHFRGHTEYLADQAGVKSFAMMFVSPRLKVTLVTIHVPICQVSGLIVRKRVFEKIKLTHDFLKQYRFCRSPKIAVCALNPHGRETGTEDEKEIRPAVLMAKQRGMRVQGPLSADQLFYDAYEGRFDAVVSMYHDQGLAPFKMISFKDGVNTTLGLPFIRTSPDHGTAFDIAYRNQADPSSFLAALQLAERLVLKK